MIGPIGADRRDALTIAFERKYGISVEYHADSGAGILPRLSAERKADRYLWDVVVTGTDDGTREPDSGSGSRSSGAESYSAGGKRSQIVAQWHFGIPRSGTAIVGHDAFSTRHAVCQSDSGQSERIQIV